MAKDAVVKQGTPEPDFDVQQSAVGIGVDSDSQVGTDDWCIINFCACCCCCCGGGGSAEIENEEDIVL